MGYKTVIYFGLPAAMIVYGAASIKLKVPPLLLYLGEASYSIYLFYGVLFAPIVYLLDKYILFFSMHAYFSFCITVLGLISVCCIIYDFIEKPLILFIRDKVSNMFWGEHVVSD